MVFYKGQKWDRPKRQKHKRAKGSIRTDASQRKTLHAVRLLLAEKGFQIYPVATWFRRSSRDFVAVPKENPQQLLLVRPGQRRTIEFLSYTGIDAWVRNYLEARSDANDRLVWEKKLLPVKDAAHGWETFISRNCKRELYTLTDVR